MPVSVTHRDRDRLIRHFKTVLAEAMERRADRRQLVQTPNGVEVEWVLFERETMLAAVNEARHQLGLPPTPLAALERVERQAEGHIDYHAKFALYCTELALDECRRVW